MVETNIQLPIGARRTLYLLIVVIWLMLVAMFGKLLEFGVVRDIDWTYFALIGPLFGLCLLSLVLMAMRLVWPPLLNADDQGLSLRIGLRTRRWTWAQIESFRIVRTKETFVAFNFYPREGARMKGKWLQYPFPGSAEGLLATLDARLEAARSSGVIAATAPVLSEDARKAEDEGFERLKKQSNVTALVAIGTFIACIIALNLQTTKMITPGSSALSWSLALGVGTIGLLIPFTLLRLSNARPSAPVPLGKNILLAAILGPASFTMFAAIGSMMADEVSDHLAFSGRYGPVTTHEVDYQIEHVISRRGGMKVVTYPYGLASADLPINPVDALKIRAASENHPLCYPVIEQRSGPAIRYIVPSAGIGNRSIVVPCQPGRTAPSV